MVSDFLMDGFAQEQPGLLIATTAHTERILDELRQTGFDVERMTAEERLVVLDAEVALGAFMKNGMPDPEMFRRVIIPFIERASADRAGCVIRAFGEMVDVLWQRGQTIAATRLEMLWNDLAQTRDFSLLCGYSMGSFYKDADTDQIRARHTHILEDCGEPRPVA